MARPTKFAVPLTAILVLAAALTGIAWAALTSPQERDDMETLREKAPIPPIDAKATKSVETATFALG